MCLLTRRIHSLQRGIPERNRSHLRIYQLNNVRHADDTLLIADTGKNTGTPIESIKEKGEEGTNHQL